MADENFSADAVDRLRAEGHDVAWIRTEAPGIDDLEVLARAVQDDRILLTFDKDFGQIAVHAVRTGLQASCGIVLFRLPMNVSTVLAEQISAAIQSRTDWAGRFTVVEPGRIRSRDLSPPEPDDS
ncbi:MAG: DUF5615 family PIN-like protein [Planctomycetia bacterium]